MSTPEPNGDVNPDNATAKNSESERVGFDDVQPFNLDPSYDPREGLWDPERNTEHEDVADAVPEPAPPVPVVKRKRALPKSWVKLTLRAMFVLIVLAALWGLVY